MQNCMACHALGRRRADASVTDRYIVGLFAETATIAALAGCAVDSHLPAVETLQPLSPVMGIDR
jgi:hypothetical protein